MFVLKILMGGGEGSIIRRHADLFSFFYQVVY